MAVLQRMQEETAQLHRRFLEGQETAGRTIQSLLEQQQRLFLRAARRLPLRHALLPATASAPATTAPRRTVSTAAVAAAHRRLLLQNR